MKTLYFLFGLSLSLLSEVSERACALLKGKNPLAKNHAEEQREYWEEFKNEQNDA